MLQRYLTINNKWRNWLWWVVVIALIASAPLIIKRVQTERSTNQVEIVFDYRDLLEASVYRANPEQYIQEQLNQMKEIGIGSMSIYEATLEELKLSRRIQVFNGQEYSLLTGKPTMTVENNTYILFTSEEANSKIRPILERTYRDRLKVSVTDWSYNDRKGLIIGLPYEEANTKPIEPDPMTMDMLQQSGFHLVGRMSNRIQPLSMEEVEHWLKMYSQRGVKRIVFDGAALTGYDEEPDDNQVKELADLLVKYKMGTAVIERLKEQQKGMTLSFAERIDYNIVRLFPLYDTEASLKPEQIADKLVLAVKDRNMRMLFLNIKPAKDMEKGYIKDNLDHIYDSLTGPDGAIERIQRAGYELGEAHAFVNYGQGLQPLKWIVMLGGVALIALMIGLFFPSLVIAAFVLGTIGVAGLYVLSSSIALQMTAFGASVAAPSLATILAIRYIRSRHEGSKLSWLKAVLIFLATTAVTATGILFVVALLSGISYYLVLQQFRGVAMLHLLPIALVGVYALFFADTNNISQVWERLRQLLMARITVIWVVLGAVGAGALYYYLTRTGNEGQASQTELMLRTLLENNMGVRPRFKEFMFAHPLFIVAAYLYAKYRNAIYLFAGAVMGQLSLVDTFAHLHTPLYISAIRVGYGMLIGIVVSLIYVAIWTVLERGWRRWLAAK